MKVVIALGGNALLRRGEELTEEVQQRNVLVAADAIAQIASKHQTIVTHGNGPQVGLLALEGEAYGRVPPYGLDVLGAETQGMVGFLLEQALRNALPQAQIATLLTSVLVDPEDPGFTNPTKPIGPVYSQAEAEQITVKRGWSIAPDGTGYRRVVPSPQPREILELLAIEALVAAGILVICAGGGGVPVVRRPDGILEGVEGVVDKDMTSALLAEKLDADLLMLLTDVPFVETDWGTPNARPILKTTPRELRGMRFATGSMAPKVEAACRFVENTGRPATIGALTNASAMLKSTKGTIVVPF